MCHLFSCAMSLSSSLVQCTNEGVHVTTALRQNGYPNSLIRKCNVLQSSILAQVPSEPEICPVATVTLPYVQGVSESVRRILHTINICVRLCPHSTFCKMLVRPKDPIPSDACKGIIYRIPCKDCDQCYIGRSGRTLASQLNRHQQAVANEDSNASTLAEHVLETRHQIDWPNSTVLDSCQFYY